MRLRGLMTAAALASLAAMLPFVWMRDASEAGAVTYQNPHGAFTSSTSYCLVCHQVHEAPGNILERYAPESTVCFTCHNGTGSNYNVQVQLDADPVTSAMHQIQVNLTNNSGTYQYEPPRTTAGLAPPGPYVCSDCHEPHGESNYPRLLKNNYARDEYVAYPGTGADPYEACWTCHSREQILADETYFSLHKIHIIDNESSCTACHYSPHGVPQQQKLVRFNPGFVTSSIALNRGPAFQDQGASAGSCTLTCHGADHASASYGSG